MLFPRQANGKPDDIYTINRSFYGANVQYFFHMEKYFTQNVE